MTTGVTEIGRATSGAVTEIGEAVIGVGVSSLITAGGRAGSGSGGGTALDMIALLLTLDVDGTRILVNRRPPPAGSPVISQVSAVEGVAFTLDPPANLEVTWSLVPIRAQYWILGDSVYGSLGVTTRPGF